VFTSYNFVQHASEKRLNVQTKSFLEIIFLNCSLFEYLKYFFSGGSPGGSPRTTGQSQRRSPVRGLGSVCFVLFYFHSFIDENSKT
jgi:hypothetical protein